MDSIKENEEKLKQNWPLTRHYTEGGNGCCLACDGQFYRVNESVNHYMAKNHHFDADSIITMILDMNNYTLSYKFNDKDYGIATKELDKHKYRLLVSLYNNNDCVELS